MSFGLQNIFLLDRQFIVLIHMPNCRTGAEQSKGSRCEKMLLHLCLPQTDLAAITETLRRFIRVPLWRPPYRRSFPTQSQKFGLNPNRSKGHTSERQTLMRNSFDVLCLKTKK